MKQTTPLIITLILAALLLGAVAIVALNSHTSNPQPQRIDLPESTTYRALCDTLRAHQILPPTNRPSTFPLIAHLRGLHRNLHPGSYLINPHTTQLALVQKLYRGQQDPIRLTIGKHRLPEQLQTYLDSKLMHNNFSVPLDSLHLVRPDTYQVYWTLTPADFLRRMRREYNQFWNRRTLNDTLRATLRLANIADTDHQRAIIILASIIEEETNHNPEKPLIASVYLNRLRRGIPLQADPTVKYALGDFTLRRILNQHLATPSPFNTYLHTGLPPAPICLPSAASVDAILNAPSTPYLYFCASDAMDGTHRFAASLAEHNRNAARFHNALNSRGIR